MLNKKNTILLLSIILLLTAQSLFCGQKCSGQPAKQQIQEPNSIETWLNNTENSTKDSANKWLNDPDEPPNLLKNFSLAIIFVIVLGGCAYYFSRRIAPKLAINRGKNIEVLDSMNLGQNKMLHIIQVGRNKQILIGTTNQSINMIADVTDSMSAQLNMDTGGN